MKKIGINKSAPSISSLDAVKQVIRYELEKHQILLTELRKVERMIVSVSGKKDQEKLQALRKQIDAT